MNRTYLPFYRRKWKISTKKTNEVRIRAHLTSLYEARKQASLRRDELQNLLDAKAHAGLSHSVIAHLRVGSPAGSSDGRLLAKIRSSSLRACGFHLT